MITGRETLNTLLNNVSKKALFMGQNGFLDEAQEMETIMEVYRNLLSLQNETLFEVVAMLGWVHSSLLQERTITFAQERKEQEEQT